MGRLFMFHIPAFEVFPFVCYLLVSLTDSGILSYGARCYSNYPGNIPHLPRN